jgi:SprT protein
MDVAPIGPERQRCVVETTRRTIARASVLFGLDFAEIPVTFELRGRAAGMYRVQRGRRLIRYNPYLFAKYYRDNLANTVPHEVAHYITDVLYGLRNVRPHGPEWQAVMHALGAQPEATCRYDLDGIPVRRQRRFTYRCACTTHSLSAGLARDAPVSTALHPRDISVCLRRPVECLNPAACLSWLSGAATTWNQIIKQQ